MTDIKQTPGGEPNSSVGRNFQVAHRWSLHWVVPGSSGGHCPITGRVASFVVTHGYVITAPGNPGGPPISLH